MPLGLKIKAMREKSLILDPVTASKIKALDLRAKLIVEGFLVGLHRSPYHGFSVEFAEHRPYNIGDDIRWLDWRVFARTERLYIRKFEEETNLRAYIVIDASGSMGYGDKMDYTISLAASIAYLLNMQRDAVGLIVFSDSVKTALPPRMSRPHLMRILKNLSSIKPEGKTHPMQSFKVLAETMRKKGLIIFISDFFGDTEGFIKGLKLLRRLKHEVIAFQIIDKRELKLDGSASIFEDMETGERIPFDPRSMSDVYRQVIDDFKNKVKHELLSGLVEYELLDTSTPFDIALIKFLRKREKLR